MSNENERQQGELIISILLSKVVKKSQNEEKVRIPYSMAWVNKKNETESSNFVFFFRMAKENGLP